MGGKGADAEGQRRGVAFESTQCMKFVRLQFLSNSPFPPVVALRRLSPI